MLERGNNGEPREMVPFPRNSNSDPRNVNQQGTRDRNNQSAKSQVKSIKACPQAHFITAIATFLLQRTVSLNCVLKIVFCFSYKR
jgi:hypothetical protein